MYSSEMNSIDVLNDSCRSRRSVLCFKKNHSSKICPYFVIERDIDLNENRDEC